MTVGLAQFLTVTDASGTVLDRWQNYWINETVDGFAFAPFNVAGLISKVSSGAESVEIQFPATPDNATMIELGMQLYYIATIEQYQFLPPVSGVPSSKTKIGFFTGEFQSAEFNESSLLLGVGANLDSTESQVPPRNFTTVMVGFPPKL
nr:putative phage minor tail protein [uncultured Mediterranean phage uvMED]